MAVIATLATEVVAHTGGFIKGMKGAVASAAEFQSALEKTRGTKTFTAALKEAQQEAKIFARDVKAIEAEAGKTIGSIRQDMLGVSSMSGLPMTGGEAALLAREEKASIAHMANRQVGGGDTGMYAARIIQERELNNLSKQRTLGWRDAVKGAIALKAAVSGIQIIEAARRNDDEAIVEIYRSFPVFGAPVVEFFETIADLTGRSRAFLKEQTEELARQAPIVQAIAAASAARVAEQKQHADRMTAIGQENNLMGLAGFDRDRLQADFDVANRVRARQAAMEAEVSAMRAEARKLTQGMTEEGRIDAINTQLGKDVAAVQANAREEIAAIQRLRQPMMDAIARREADKWQQERERAIEEVNRKEKRAAEERAREMKRLVDERRREWEGIYGQASATRTMPATPAAESRFARSVRGVVLEPNKTDRELVTEMRRLKTIAEQQNQKMARLVELASRGDVPAVGMN